MTEIHIPETPGQLRWLLSRKLSLWTVVIGISAGTLAYWLESWRTEDQAIQHAIASVRHFETPAMQLTMSATSNEHASLEQLLNRDQLIGIRVFSRDKEMLFERWGSIPEALITAIRRQTHLWPGANTSHSNRVEVSGEQLIQVVLPLLAKDGSLAGYVEGVSRVTPEARQGQREQVRNTSITAAASVLAAAVLLYPLMLAMLRRSRRLARRLLDANLSLMHSLGNAIAKRDSDTDAHNYRVTCYAVALAESLNIPGKTISDLVVGAFLHDVGKIGIPDHILLKPGKLTAEEFAIMQTHTLLGVEIVADNPWLTGATQTIRHHHERHDGTGYPDGLSGGEIPLVARIFALVDVFDALTSVRPYKPALSLAETIAIMEREAGSHFDPEIYAYFMLLAPALYEKNQTWGHEDWGLELSTVLARYFNMENAPVTGR